MKKILEKIENESLNLCVTGLGYVGLPLAIELSQVFEVFGLDTDKRRIEELTKDLIEPARFLLFSYNQVPHSLLLPR